MCFSVVLKAAVGLLFSFDSLDGCTKVHNEVLITIKKTNLFYVPLLFANGPRESGCCFDYLEHFVSN